MKEYEQLEFPIETIDLKPCPFCGSVNLRCPKNITIYRDIRVKETNVQCINCGADGPKIAYVDDVKKGWNERS